MGLKKGCKGNNQKTGKPAEDKKRFAHKAVVPTEDSRCTAFAKLPKDKIIAQFLEGDIDAMDPDVYRAMKLTTKEKALLMQDPRFRDLWEAHGLDVMVGARDPNRQQWDAYKLIGQRLGYYKHTSKGNTFTVPDGADIQLTVGTSQKPKPIDVTPEGDGQA